MGASDPAELFLVIEVTACYSQYTWNEPTGKAEARLTIPPRILDELNLDGLFSSLITDAVHQLSINRAAKEAEEQAQPEQEDGE